MEYYETVRKKWSNEICLHMNRGREYYADPNESEVKG